MKFEEIYEIERVFDNVLQTKTIRKDSIEYKCRFCSQENKSKFKKDAHIIPESLGNRYLLSTYECDSCNNKFGQFENSLCNFIGPIRTLGFIEGKSKKRKRNRNRIPIFKNSKTGTRIEADYDSTNFFTDKMTEHFKEVIKDKAAIFLGKISDEILYDNETETIKYSVTKTPYIPLDAFKSLLKIGYSFLSEKDVEKFYFTQRFLNKKGGFKPKHDAFKNFNKIIRITYPHINYFPTPKGILYTKKETRNDLFIPEKVFILFLKCYSFQIPLIFSDNDITELRTSGGKYNFYPMKSQIKADHLANNNFRIEEVDLSSTELNKEDKFEVETTKVLWKYKF